MLWNSSVAIKSQRDLEVVLNNEKVDVCPISEALFTREPFARFRNCEVYHTIYPQYTARGGSAVILIASNQGDQQQTHRYC